MTDTPGPLGRRIVPRVRADWVWQVTVPAKPSLLRRRRDTLAIAAVVDLSVVGARIRCIEAREFGVGTVITFDADGEVGTAVVRRVYSADTGDLGVEFVKVSSTFLDRVGERTDPTKVRTVDVWNQAT